MRYGLPDELTQKVERGKYEFKTSFIILTRPVLFIFSTFEYLWVRNYKNIFLFKIERVLETKSTVLRKKL